MLITMAQIRARRLQAVIVVLVAQLLTRSSLAAGQAPQALVRGGVTDGSGGFLPGVTVVATTAGGRVLATTTTDGVGAYVFEGLPAGSLTLTFELEGFVSVTVRLKVQPGTNSQVVERLELAPYSETVVVRAPAMFAQPPPLAPTVPLLPRVRPVPQHDRDSICGPAKRATLPDSLGTIRSGHAETERRLYAAGAELLIDGGLRDGLTVGRNLVARRYYRVREMTGAEVVAEHSAGLVQIVAAGEQSAVGVVVYACDELRPGDFLAPFKPEPIREPDPPGTPAYPNAARILFADDGQMLAAPRQLMVIDRGSARGVRVGERLTLFRLASRNGRRDIIGEALVVAVRSDSATIRVVRVTDAVSAGDWAAPQAASSAALQPREP
jgi:hypothetical protein